MWIIDQIKKLRRSKKDEVKVLMLWIPVGTDLDNFINVFTHNGIHVDDACSVNSRLGRLMSLWIPVKDFDSMFNSLSQHCGAFMNTLKGENVH